MTQFKLKHSESYAWRSPVSGNYYIFNKSASPVDDRDVELLRGKPDMFVEVDGEVESHVEGLKKSSKSYTKINSTNAGAQATREAAAAPTTKKLVSKKAKKVSKKKK